MLIPAGFTQQSVPTPLGAMVYYTATSPWLVPEIAQSSLPELPESAETLVFCHGFGGGSSAYEWSQVYPAFVGDARILAPDLIGWGHSAHPARRYTAEDYLTTLTSFLEQTCDRPVTVVASSLTAALVIRIAIDRPDLFRALILTTPSGLSDFGEDYSRSLIAQIVTTPVVDRLLYQLGIANPAGIQSFLSQRQFANPERIFPEIVSAYLASAKEPQAEDAALSFVRGDLCFDLARYVPQLTTPTAILWGDKSQFTSPELGRRLAQLNPTAIRFFHPLTGVGLTPQLEQPALTIALVRRYWSLLSAHA